MLKAADRFKKHINYKPNLEQNILKVLEDNKVDVCSLMAIGNGKMSF